MRIRQAKGFTLIEAVVAMAVLAGGLFALIASMAGVLTTYAVTSQTRIALQAISNEIELMQAQVSGLTATGTAAFVGTTTFAVAGLPDQASGAAASGTITFLTEAAANAYWGSSVGVDLDQNGVVNEAKAPSTTTPQKLYAVIRAAEEAKA